MGVIVPAILPASRVELEEKLALLRGVAEEVQIDIVDGRFASPATWPYASGSHEFAKAVDAGETLSYLGEFKFEIDLMVSEPEAVTGTWLAAGANRLTIHAESTTYLPRVITDLRVRYGYAKDFAPGLLSLGLALNLESELALVDQYADSIDYVQFMGIKRIGRQNEPFDERVIQKILIFKKQHPHIEVQVDGGVSPKSAPALLHAGVDRLIVGGDLWKATNVKEEYEKLSTLVETYGIYE